MKIFDFLNFRLNEELDFNMVETKFKEIPIDSIFIKNEKDTIYRFITKSLNFYDLYFSLTEEFGSKLKDNTYITDYTNDYIPTIFFSLTNRGLNVDTFDLLTNKNEKFEVMGKVIYLIDHFVQLNNYNVYSIGEVSDEKYRFYSYYLHNLPYFTIKEGTSNNYNGKMAYYLIKK
jgi:hypothetical protein